ncbi:MAG: 4-hydroxy-tetrahydrodipicolinate synthase [Clostridia bacterium]|nr:4-hydroxy-tetrahydrodipicolinate synthase [Clostridia bacterium]
MLNLSGSGVALVTPFTNKNNINYDKLDELIEFHIKNNTDFLVPCGTTGESSSLSNTEKKKLIKYTVNKCKGKIPVIAGTGSNNTKITIEMSKYAKSVGADGVLVVTPYYNKTNQEGLFAHYKKIADAIYPLPLILYNVPSRTGIDISVDTIVRLSKIENILGIKEANPSLEKIANIILKTDDSFKVFSGNDNLLLPILSLGGAGVISVSANIIPKQMHDICKNTDKNLFFKYLELMDNLFLDVNPIMIKEAMNYLGFNIGKVRLPLYKTKKENLDKLYKYLDTIKDEI